MSQVVETLYLAFRIGLLYKCQKKTKHFHSRSARFYHLPLPTRFESFTYRSTTLPAKKQTLLIFHLRCTATLKDKEKTLNQKTKKCEGNFDLISIWLKTNTCFCDSFAFSVKDTNFTHRQTISNNMLHQIALQKKLLSLWWSTFFAQRCITCCCFPLYIEGVSSQN